MMLAGRSWRPLPVVALGAVAPVLLFAAFGFRLWEAYPVLTDRYWAGIAASRPAAYCGIAAFKREILQLCFDRLAPHKVPATIRFVPTLEFAAAGKLARHA